MRPRLHPDMGQIVISARVAIQLVYLRYRLSSIEPASPSDCAHQCARDLNFAAMPMLKMALHSLSIYLDVNWTSLQWLQAVLEAAHLGHTFRRCFHFDYKENRSPYPRVTNRGVQNSSNDAGAGMRKAKRNA